MRPTHVLVVGGGYAGVMAANRIAGRSEPSVEATLVDPGRSFTERIRLHQVATGVRPTASLPWEHVLHPRVRRRQGHVSRIDAQARTATVTGQEPVDFDYLVYAVGSARQHSPLPTVTDPRSAERTAQHLDRLEPGAPVTVAGAGLTGIETAAAIASARPDLSVTMVSPHGPRGAPAQVEAVTARLQALGVTIRHGVVDPGTGIVSYAGAPEPDAPQAVLWTAGFAYPTLAADSGLPTAPGGRLVVDSTLTVADAPHVIGAGDAAQVSGVEHHRPSCTAALPLGRHAAGTVLAHLAGHPPQPVRLRYFAQCLDLAQGHGHVQFVTQRDVPRAWHLPGRTGGWLKEQVCRSTISWLRREARR